MLLYTLKFFVYDCVLLLRCSGDVVMCCAVCVCVAIALSCMIVYGFDSISFMLYNVLGFV